jgi:hypothetical protein
MHCLVCLILRSEIDPGVSVILLLMLLGISLIVALIKKSAEKGVKTQQSEPSVHIEMSGPHRRDPVPFAVDEKRAFYQQVHGVKFKNDDGSSRQQIIKACSVGEELDLVPEPDNRYDSDAVKVCRQNGQQLGYLPSGNRMAQNGVLDNDYRVTIEEIYPFEEDPRMRGCRLRIGVLKPPD